MTAASTVEMAGISGRDSRAPGRGDADDLHVADLHRPSAALVARGNRSCGLRGRQVERLHTAGEVFG